MRDPINRAYERLVAEGRVGIRYRPGTTQPEMWSAGEGPPPYRKETAVQLDPSDAQKILDTLLQNEEYHTKRDEMNAAIHRAGSVRYSPITSETIAQRERLQALMQEQGVPM